MNTANKSIFEKFSEIVKDNEITKQEGTFSLLHYAGCIGGCFPPFCSRYYDFDFGTLVFIMQGNHGLVLFELSKYIQTTDATFKKYQTDKDKISEIVDFKNIWGKIDEMYSEYTGNKINTLESDELDNLIKSLFRYFHELLAATVFSESLDEAQVRKYYSEVVSDGTSFDEFFQNASKPVFDSFVLRIDKGLADENRNIDQLQYLFSDYFITPSPDALDKKIEAMVSERGGREKIKQEIEKIENELADNKKVVEAYREKLPANLQTLFDFIQFSMYIRDVRKEPLQKILAMISNTARKIFSEKGMNTDDAIYAVYSDFDSGLYKAPEYAEEIDKRKNSGCEVLFTNQGVDFEYGQIEEKKKQLFSLMDKGSESINEVKGNIAFKGKVEGIAQIILSEKDFGKFKDGGVLVTSMTRPEFVPLMKKAAAIVTDEGGITCHAAIVSRELKIPCITGTKNATRVLKDGDLIEVDANSGIVNILKAKI